MKNKLTNMERINKAEMLNVVDKASVKLEDELFHIKKHSDKTILIYDKNDNVLYESVLPILRKINIYQKLQVDLFYPNSTEKKNTRDLGKDLINKLNKKKI